MITKSLAYVFEPILPFDLIYVIDSYLPRPYKKKKEHSPSMQKQLTKIQNMFLKGKSGMYMKYLEDFCLD